MPVKDCIKNYKPALVARFDEMVSSGINEYEAARDIILDEHKLLFDQLNQIKKDAGIKEAKYVQPKKKNTKAVVESVEEKRAKKQADVEKKKEAKKADVEKKGKEREAKKIAEKEEKEAKKIKDKADKQAASADKKQKEQEEKQQKKSDNAKKSKDEMISILMKRHGITERAAQKIIAASRAIKNVDLLRDELKKIIKEDKDQQSLKETPKAEAPKAQPKAEAGSVGVVDVKLEKPSAEQQLKDIQEGNMVTFEYKNESEVPEVFKDKISSKGEVNGKTYVKVTMAKSLADYHLQEQSLKETPKAEAGSVGVGAETSKENLSEVIKDDLADVEGYESILEATKTMEGKEQREMAASANKTFGQAKKDFEQNNNVQVSPYVLKVINGDVVKGVLGEHRTDITDKTYLFDVLTDAFATSEQRGAAGALILAHRISAGNSFMANVFNSARKRDKGDGVVKVIFNPAENSSIITAHDDGSITINAYQIGLRIDDFGGEKRFFSWAEMAMYEEVIHLATFKVATSSEIEQVGRELSAKEKDIVEKIYGKRLEQKNLETDKMEPDYLALGLEYIRQIQQNAMFGTTTELLKSLRRVEPEKRTATKIFFSKLLRFLADAFSRSRRERMSSEIIDRLDTYLGRKNKDDKFKTPEQVIAERPKTKVFDQPKNQPPVFMFEYRNRQYLFQKGRVKSGEAWFEVQKMQDGFYTPVNDGSEIPGLLGVSFTEAVHTLLARGGKGYGVSDSDPRPLWTSSGVAGKLSKTKMNPGKWDTKSQEKASLYSKAGLLFHGSDSKIAKFDGERIKGGSRSVLGWGIYFSSSPYKASDYGTTFTYIDSSQLNILDADKPVTQELVDKVKKAAKHEKDAVISAYYSVVADKLRDQIGERIDNARKTISSSFVWNTDKHFSMLLRDIGYDAMKSGYEYVLFNLEKTDAVVDNPDAHLDKLYRSGKFIDEIEGFIQDTTGYGVSTNVEDDDIDKLAKEILDDLMSEYIADSGVSGDPVRDRFKWVYGETMIIQDSILTEMKRDEGYSPDISDGERRQLLLKDSEAVMLNIIEDVFAKSNFDDAISYIIGTLKDESLSLDVRNMVSKLVKEKLKNTHPDIVNYIRERLEYGEGGLAEKSSRSLSSRRLMNVDETFQPEKDKPVKPKRGKKPISIKEMFKNNELNADLIYLLEQSEDGYEIANSMYEIQRRMQKNKVSSDEEVALVGLMSEAAEEISAIRKTAEEASGLVNKMYSEVRKFKAEDKELAAQRRKSNQYQMMARRGVDNMSDLAKQIKASIKQIIEKC